MRVPLAEPTVPIVQIFKTGRTSCVCFVGWVDIPRVYDGVAVHHIRGTTPVIADTAVLPFPLSMRLTRHGLRHLKTSRCTPVVLPVFAYDSQAAMTARRRGREVVKSIGEFLGNVGKNIGASLQYHPRALVVSSRPGVFRVQDGRHHAALPADGESPSIEYAANQQFGVLLRRTQYRT